MVDNRGQRCMAERRLMPCLHTAMVITERRYRYVERHTETSHTSSPRFEAIAELSAAAADEGPVSQYVEH